MERIKHRNGVECIHGKFLHEYCATCRIAELELENEQHRRNEQAEIAGIMRLRSKYGALDNETFPQFVKRMAERIAELEAHCDELQRGKNEELDRIAKLEARLDALKKDFAGCMRTTAEDIEDWGAYASPYFQEKHGLKTEVERYRSKAAALEQTDEND